MASLARPGGNFTGTTQQAPDIVGKRLQLLAQAIPHIHTVPVVWNAANLANAGSWREVQDAARVLGIRLQSREVRGPSDFEGVFAAMAREHPDALLLIGDRLTLQHGKEIVGFANQKCFPSMLDRAYPETASVMMSYGADEDELWRRAAVIADKVFKGTKPADYPHGTADEVQVRHQSQDLESSRAHRSADTPAAGGSSDRVACREKRRTGFNRMYDLQPRRSDSIHDAEREMSNAAVIVSFVSQHFTNSQWANQEL